MDRIAIVADILARHTQLSPVVRRIVASEILEALPVETTERLPAPPVFVPKTSRPNMAPEPADPNTSRSNGETVNEYHARRAREMRPLTAIEEYDNEFGLPDHDGKP